MIEVVVVFDLFYVVQSKKWPQGASVKLLLLYYFRFQVSIVGLDFVLGYFFVFTSSLHSVGQLSSRSGEFRMASFDGPQRRSLLRAPHFPRQLN